jgi:hypothetical protein
MEYMDRGTLQDYLGGRKDDMKHVFLPFATACDISVNIINGLRYLHSIGLVHRDLKPDNILLRSKEGNEFFAQIADFGLSNFCRDENSNTMSLKTLRSDVAMGTIQYMAPELLGLGPYHYGEPTDMFAWGMIQWGLVSHENPYHDGRFPPPRSAEYNGAVRKYVRNGSREKILERAAPKAWWELTEKCWAHNPQDRPKAEEALEQVLEIRAAFLNHSNSSSSQSSSSGSSSHAEIQVITARRGSVHSIHSTIGSSGIGSMRLAEFELENPLGRGNGFYAAVVLQMKKTNRGFLVGLNIAAEATVEETLQALVEGTTPRAEEDKDEAIFCLVERSDSIVAIINMHRPHLGFLCYFTDRNGERKKSYDVLEVPTRRPIIRLAYNGERFLSVKEHPDLIVGGLRARFNGETLGGYSLASSTIRLSSSRQAFTAQMSNFRGSAATSRSSLRSDKGKEEESRSFSYR